MEPGAAETSPAGVTLEADAVYIVQAAGDGQAYLGIRSERRGAALSEVFRRPEEPDGEDFPIPGLYRFDPETGSIEEHAILYDTWSHFDFGFWFGRRLSPSGRYWRLRGIGDLGDIELVDLRTGEHLHLPFEREPGAPQWAAGDRLVWTERAEGEAHERVFIDGPGRQRALLAEGTDLRLEVSPDRRRLWMAEAEVDAGYWVIRKAFRVYDVESGTWSELSAPAGLESGYRVAWAGPTTLALSSGEAMLLMDLTRPEKVRAVDGPW
jgi:hypothetical protein